MVAGRQFHSEPLSKRIRVRSQIDDTVEDSAGGTSDKLCLAVRSCLIMHASDGPLLFVEGDIAFDDPRIKPVSLELGPRPAAREKAAVVLMSLGLNDEDAVEFCLSEDHGGSLRGSLK